MICRACHTEHPPGDIANPHYCISRMEECIARLEAALRECLGVTHSCLTHSYLVYTVCPVDKIIRKALEGTCTKP